METMGRALTKLDVGNSGTTMGFVPLDAKPNTKSWPKSNRAWPGAGRNSTVLLLVDGQRTVAPSNEIRTSRAPRWTSSTDLL